jgi:hypothetical protein
MQRLAYIIRTEANLSPVGLALVLQEIFRGIAAHARSEPLRLGSVKIILIAQSLAGSAARHGTFGGADCYRDRP